MNNQEMDFIKYLINELARRQITITKNVYQEIKDYIETPAGQLAFNKFSQTNILVYLKTKSSMGFNSTLRNMADYIPEHFKKGL